MNEQAAHEARHERDYIERTIETVRNHRNADNCWPQWANIFADEIEASWARVRELEAALQRDIHILENIADPYNERIGRLKEWANDALAVSRAALAASPVERPTHGRNCACTPCRDEDWDEVDRLRTASTEDA